MKKNREIKIKISSGDYEKIKTQAETLGLAISTYCRLVCLSVKSPLIPIK